MNLRSSRFTKVEVSKRRLRLVQSLARSQASITLGKAFNSMSSFILDQKKMYFWEDIGTSTALLRLLSHSATFENKGENVKKAASFRSENGVTHNPNSLKQMSIIYRNGTNIILKLFM